MGFGLMGHSIPLAAIALTVKRSFLTRTPVLYRSEEL